MVNGNLGVGIVLLRTTYISRLVINLRNSANPSLEITSRKVKGHSEFLGMGDLGVAEGAFGAAF